MKNLSDFCWHPIFAATRRLIHWTTTRALAESKLESPSSWFWQLLRNNINMRWDVKIFHCVTGLSCAQATTQTILYWIIAELKKRAPYFWFFEWPPLWYNEMHPKSLWHAIIALDCNWIDEKMNKKITINLKNVYNWHSMRGLTRERLNKRETQ